MKCTFLGHQSWLITIGKTNILIDPILDETFGCNNENGIEIFPPRKIRIDDMPMIDAIYLSHEHFDHFHIPSLCQFPNAPVILGPLMFNFVEDLIRESGLITKRIQFFQSFIIKDIEIIIFPAGNDTVLWESRVAQIYIRSIHDLNRSMFIAVDALISKDYIELVNNGVLPSAQTVIVSNNSQITPEGVLGTLDNHRNPNDYIKRGAYGVKILDELIIAYLEDLDCKNVVICGGGFTKKYETTFGPYLFSDQKALAHLGNLLVSDKVIFGPWPGETIKVEETVSWGSPVDWVEIDHNKLTLLMKSKEEFESSKKILDIRPLFDNNKELTLTAETKTLFHTELLDFGRYFLISDAGDKLVKELINSKENKGNHVFLFIFRQKNNSPFYYALNINSCQFEIVDDDNTKEIPSGVECYFNDFIAMLKGELQIWDIVGISMKSWYTGSDKLKSPICCLYNWYAEPTRPDLAYINLKNRWKSFNTTLKEQLA